MNKSRLLKRALGLALGICAAAAPGYCGTITSTINISASNSSSLSNNDVTVNTSNNTLSAFSAVPYNGTLQIGNAPDAADDGLWTINSAMTLTVVNGVDTFTLTGTITCFSTCTAGSNLNNVSGTLEQFTEATVPATGNGTSHLLVAYQAATSFTDVLMDDIGFASNAATTITSGGVTSSANGTQVGSSSSYTFSPTSETLDLTVVGNAAPEPVSFYLMGGGLLGIAWFARRRSVRI